jgi:hypothetical protein
MPWLQSSPVNESSSGIEPAICYLHVCDKLQAVLYLLVLMLHRNRVNFCMYVVRSVMQGVPLPTKQNLCFSVRPAGWGVRCHVACAFSLLIQDTSDTIGQGCIDRPAEEGVGVESRQAWTDYAVGK